MNDEITRVIAELGNELLSLAHQVLEEHDIGSGSALYKDIKIKIDTNKNPIVVETYFGNYITYIENGRKPMTGKKPPIDALREWALSKNLPTDNDTLFAISHAIWRDGIEGRPILATLEERIEEYMDGEFYDKLTNAITNELTKYFN